MSGSGRRRNLVVNSVKIAGGNILQRASSKHKDNGGNKIKGKVILMRPTVLNTAVLDNVSKIFGTRVSLQLISATLPSVDDSRGKVGVRASLEEWPSSVRVDPPLVAGESVFRVNFDWTEDFGCPGAFFIRNDRTSEFFLKSMTLDDVPGYGRVHFDCNSWVYPSVNYQKDRIFFANNTYLPSETPDPLRIYREEELQTLRGDGTGKRETWDRIYDYDVYNDISIPEWGSRFVRPVFGGSAEFPYPRRGRTGRAPSKSDPKYEERLSVLSSFSIYVPRDESFSNLKLSEFIAFGVKSGSSTTKQALVSDLVDSTPGDFDSFKQVLDLFKGGLPTPANLFRNLTQNFSVPFLNELTRADGKRFLKFPTPHVIKEDSSAWKTDDEFAREMLAGVNPLIIRRLDKFPPVSKLDPKIYGNQNSTIREEHINYGLDGLSVDEAMKQNKLYILDHHDSVMPFLRRINSTSSKAYASRTLLFLKNDGTLRPLVIELSLPHAQRDEYGVHSRLYFPSQEGVESSIWQLAKAYVTVNDAGYHQLISHWLLTHAVIEPFVIATNRQLSVVHPIHKLLVPHFKDTMYINALARQVLVNAYGLLEWTHFQGQYSMELSSHIYREWNFLDQALPADLIKRGVAVEDSTAPHGIRLLIQDYPFAVDGLEIWSAIKTWVQQYCSLYYKDDKSIQDDVELQSWWQELKDKGHADKKNELWWPRMHSTKDLVDSLTIIIWIASALHAAINFGQFPYGGYVPNRPTISRRFMPEPGTSKYKALEANPEKVLLRTINGQFHTFLGISLIETLSKHASDEVYLGQRGSDKWTSDGVALEAFKTFGRELGEVENRINARNQDVRLKNRSGPVNMPYSLLIPSSTEGLTGRGIPNSISI